jgi:electron transport complex protein RnfB
MAEPEKDKSLDKKLTRREMLAAGARGAAVFGLGGIAGVIGRTAKADVTVWQIDPRKCTQCGNCATYCVLQPSAVKCVHAFRMCGYCEICFGYFDRKTHDYNTGAENQLCPTGAVGRAYVEGPYYQYVIDEGLCVGCGKCVKGCTTSGNGSLFLQIRHDRCVHCNQCSIAAACPSDAFVRVPEGEPYLLKDKLPEKEGGH